MECDMDICLIGRHTARRDSVRVSVTCGDVARRVTRLLTNGINVFQSEYLLLCPRLPALSNSFV